MRIALITNGFFVTPKTEEIKNLLVNALKDKGAELVILKNDGLTADNVSCKPPFDRALFWDKDVLLCKKLEALGVRTINCSKALANCDDKALTSVVAAEAGLPMPITVVAPFTYANIGYDNLDFLRAVTDKIDFPLVV